MLRQKRVGDHAILPLYRDENGLGVGGAGRRKGHGASLRFLRRWHSACISVTYIWFKV